MPSRVNEVVRIMTAMRTPPPSPSPPPPPPPPPPVASPKEIIKEVIREVSILREPSEETLQKIIEVVVAQREPLKQIVKEVEEKIVVAPVEPKVARALAEEVAQVVSKTVSQEMAQAIATQVAAAMSHVVTTMPPPKPGQTTIVHRTTPQPAQPFNPLIGAKDLLEKGLEVVTARLAALEKRLANPPVVVKEVKRDERGFITHIVERPQ